VSKSFTKGVGFLVIRFVAGNMAIYKD